MAAVPGKPPSGGSAPRARSRLRRLLVGAVVVLVAVNAVAAGGVLWLRTSVATLDGRLAGLKGLSAPATVSRDPRGVLYIAASTPTDGSFALGYAHAQDRLWQMEMTRRIGMGRLA